MAISNGSGGAPIPFDKRVVSRRSVLVGGATLLAGAGLMRPAASARTGFMSPAPASRPAPPTSTLRLLTARLSNGIGAPPEPLLVAIAVLLAGRGATRGDRVRNVRFSRNSRMVRFSLITLA